MNEFITWDNLNSYSIFISTVFMIVEFTKGLRYIRNIPTKQWSFIIAFLMLIMIHITNNTFNFLDVVLYILTAISISLGSNGLSDFNKSKKNINM